jgi:hypothetical protein
MLSFKDPASTAYARTAGVFYLLIAVAGAFAIGFVPMSLGYRASPDLVLQAIANQRGLFNLGMAGDTIVLVAEVMVTSMLFLMFRPVNATLSLAAAMARIGMVAVMATMLLFHAGLVYLAETPSLLAEVATLRRDIGMVFLHMHDAGIWVWQILFTLHLLILGALVVRSGRFPKILGYGLQVGSFGYVLNSIHAFAAPDFALLGQITVGFLVIVTIAEIGFALWLVIRGPRPILDANGLQAKEHAV